MRRFRKRMVTYPLLAVAGVALAVEEALWRLSAALALLGRLPVFRAIERRLQAVGPAGALTLFLVPAAALAPVKLLALYWLAGGHPVLGIGTILTAKVLGTAVVARMFQLTRPQLLSVAWFRWAYERVMRVREAAYAIWRQSAPARWWRRGMATRNAWLRRRWNAARAWISRK